jgi:5-methylcytosine-specific restriction endonuclease McrA
MGRLRNQTGTYKKLRRAVIARDGTTCRWCGIQTVRLTPALGEQQRPDQLTIDHVVPLSENGGNGVENMVIACYSCNQRRSRPRSGSAGPLRDRDLALLL